MHVCFLRKVAFKASGWIHRDYSHAHPGPFTISSSRLTVTCATDLEVIAVVQTFMLPALLSSLSTVRLLPFLTQETILFWEAWKRPVLALPVRKHREHSA